MNRQSWSGDAFRRSRFFWVGGPGVSQPGWYVECREGVRGPYSSRDHARRELAAMVRPRIVSRTRTGHAANQWM